MENPNFLKQKYNLHNTPEVELTAKRTEKQTGEKISQNPSLRIQNYLNRFTEIIERKEPAKRERGIEALKQVFHGKFVIKEEEIPESYFDGQKRLAREQGHGDIEISKEMRKQLTEVIITDQKGSLDQWIDYLSSNDATYPDWLKYYAFRSILGMGEYDKENKQFTKRSKGTVKPFPDINREALAYVLDAILKKTKKENISIQIQNEEEKKEFEKLLESENFAKLYAFAIDKVTPTSKSALTNTKGEWVKYRQGRDHRPLVESLQGHGTEWCTAGESTAEAQLKNGDFYVYYSLDKNGKPNIPRAAIRMQGNGIAEVRGVGLDQNLDQFIAPVVQAKMKEFPDGKVYEKKAGDMKYLTSIEHKAQLGKELTKDELIFLYEMNNKIEGFGYKRDPRIKELRSQRDPKKDASIALECAPNEIAWNQKEINENTKAYIGPLFEDIFITLSQIEHIYTSFPGSKIRRDTVEIENKTPKEYLAELKTQGFKISDYAKYMVEHMNVAQKNLMSKVKGVFSESKKETKQSEQIELVRLTVRDLGFANGATIDQIYQKANEFSLELCPPEVGPAYRVQYTDQPMNEYLLIAMEQISGPGGGPGVFGLDRGAGGVWLGRGFAGPSYPWGPGDGFVFRLPRFRK